MRNFRRHIVRAILPAVFLSSIACKSTRPSSESETSGAGGVQNYQSVFNPETDLLYVTNRKRSMPKEATTWDAFFGNKDGVPIELFYSANRIESVEDLEYGFSRLGIPTARKAGNSVGFELKQLNLQTKDKWLFELRNQIFRTPKREVLFILHGFGNTFADSVKLAKQVQIDTRFKGAVVLFGWDSEGKATPTAYSDDAESAEFSVDHFKHVMSMLIKQRLANKIHVLAHSMGNRVAINSLATMIGGLVDRDGQPIGQERLAKPVFENLILASPDIVEHYFRNQIRILTETNLVKRVTLYATREDWALGLSVAKNTNTERWISEGGAARRAGQGGKRLIILPGLESIDMSGLWATDALSHGLFASHPKVLADIGIMLNEDVSMLERLNGRDGRPMYQVWDNNHLAPSDYLWMECKKIANEPNQAGFDPTVRIRPEQVGVPFCVFKTETAAPN